MGEARRRQQLGLTGRERVERVPGRDVPRGYKFAGSGRVCEVCGHDIAANATGQYTRFCSGQCRKRRYRLP